MTARRATRGLILTALLWQGLLGCTKVETERRRAIADWAMGLDASVDATLEGSDGARDAGTDALVPEPAPRGAGSDAQSAPDATGDGAAAPFDPCAQVDCSGHGVCEADALGPMCVCDEGFTGSDCGERTAAYGRRVLVASQLADPDVFEIEAGRYVLSGTGTGFDFVFRESTDLETFTQVATYDPGAADPAHDYCNCWAPELARIGGTLYLYFSAHRGPKGGTSCPPPGGADVTTYRAASADGALTFGAPQLLFQGQTGAKSRVQSGCPAEGCGAAIRIDPTVHDGRLFYVYFDQGNNIASVSLGDPSDLQSHTGPADWAVSGFEESVNEAPELLQHAGRLHLFFSAASYGGQYATFYLAGNGIAELDRRLPLRRLTTPVRRGDGTLLENHGHNSIVTLRGETFNFFHVGVFDAQGGLVRRDTYRQRIAWKADGSAISQNEVRVSWGALGGSYTYSLDLVLRDDSAIGPCIAVGRIGQATSTVFTGVCPDAADRLVHKSEVQAFRLYASAGGPFLPAGEVAYDGYSDETRIAASAP